MDTINNNDQKYINILPLNLNNCFLNGNHNNFNNIVLSLKNKNNKSIKNNSFKKGNKKQNEKTITPDTKILYLKLNNRNRIRNTLENILFKANELKQNKSNIEELNKSHNLNKNKVMNYNYKNITSIKFNKNIDKNADKNNNNDRSMSNSTIFKNISKISNISLNQNSNIKISNLSDSSIIKKNKKNKNNNISSTEDPGNIHIQTFRDKKNKISKEKDKLNQSSNDKVNVSGDDKEGNYIFKIGEILLNRYEVIKNLGKGTFGNCVKCYDNKEKEFVCLKIIKNLPRYTEQAQEEMDLINYVNSPNIIKENIFVQMKNNFSYNQHICMIFELLSFNLYEEIQKTNYSGFNILTVKRFAIQLLFGLLILKTKKVIHCDLKPENILLINEGKTHIKIIDFGSSCYKSQNYYTYIQSRFYRAPEILMGLEYGYEIDMWSLGCILCELFCGIPIFPGENEYDMMYYIMEYIGVPPKELIFKSHKKRSYFTDNGEPLEKPTSFGKIRKPNKKTFEKFLKNADNDFIDLIKKIFKWKKEERITPEEALKHTWILKNMNEKMLFEHFNKIKNFMDYDYCCSLFVNEIKNFDFDENMNENNKRKSKNNNEESSNFVASFNCSFNNDNNNSLKKSNCENESNDDNNIFDDNIHINSSPRFASKIENSKENIK